MGLRYSALTSVDHMGFVMQEIKGEKDVYERGL